MMDQTQESYIEIYPEHTYWCPLPKSLDLGVHWIFCTRSQHHFPPAFVTVLAGGRVFGQNGVVISQSGKLLGDDQTGYQRPSNDLCIFNNSDLPSMEYTDDTVALLAFPFSYNYFHWMFDILPRFHLLKQSGIVCDKYILDYGGGSYQAATLALLGIPENKIIRIHPELHLKSRRLVVPSLPRHEDYIPAWACRFLRELLSNLAPCSLKQYDRVYISRNDANYRKVVNEEQVVELLEGFGFKSVSLGSIPLSEQAAIFASASIIVTPHGAGLTNLIFCKPGTKVIEIFSPNYLRHTYWWISQHLGLDYYYIIGKGKRQPHNFDPCDMEADIDVALQAKDLINYLRKYSRISLPLTINEASNIDDWQHIDQIKGWLLQSEAVALQWLVKQLPVSAKVVEIGGFSGRISVIIASALPPGGILYCFDFSIEKNNADKLEKTLRNFNVSDKTRIVSPYSPEQINEFAEESLDLILLDAGRDYQSVREDTIRWYSKLKIGGYMVFHDYGWWPGVAAAIESLHLEGYLIADSLWLHQKSTDKL